MRSLVISIFLYACESWTLAAELEKRTPNHGQETNTKVVWSCLKVFWFSKDNSTGHGEWKKKTR